MQVEKSAIKRLENNHYAMDKAYERLKEAIEVNHEQEIYTATGELLLWVMTTEEWHLEKSGDNYEKRRDSNDNGVILKGIRHAYNMMKHNMKFIQMHHKEGGLTFPFTLPMELKEITVHWIKAGEVLNGKSKKQKPNYIKYIEGKEIIKTFNQAIEFLNLEKSRYLE